MKSDQKEEMASEEKQATIAELAMETESLSTLVAAT